MKKKFIILLAILFVLTGPIAYLLGIATGKADIKKSVETVMENAKPYEFYVDTVEYPDYAYYSDAIGYNNFYTYGDGITKSNMDCIIMELFNWMPNTAKSFLQSDGILIVCNGNFQQMVASLTNDTVSEKTDGVYFTSRINGTPPVICIDYNLYNSNKIEAFLMRDFTEIHELAHYMDDLHGFSNTEEFQRYFKLYSATYSPFSPVVEGYQETSEREFFAILVTDILKSIEISQLNLPADLLEYMRNVMLTAENIEICK